MIYSTKTGAIIGGTIGGLVVILGAMIIFFLRLRRKRRRETTAYLEPTSFEIPATLANNSFAPREKTVARNQSSMTLTPLPSDPPVAPSSGTTSAQSTDEPVQSAVVDVQENTPDAQVTNEQSDFVSGSSRANVLATEVVELMGWIRAARVARGVDIQPPPDYHDIVS